MPLLLKYECSDEPSETATCRFTRLCTVSARRPLFAVIGFQMAPGNLAISSALRGRRGGGGLGGAARAWHGRGRAVGVGEHPVARAGHALDLRDAAAGRAPRARRTPGPRFAWRAGRAGNALGAIGPRRAGLARCAVATRWAARPWRSRWPGRPRRTSHGCAVDDVLGLLAQVPVGHDERALQVAALLHLLGQGQGR